LSLSKKKFNLLTIFWYYIQEWNQPKLKRIGFKRVEIEWTRNGTFLDSYISRINFELNGIKIDNPSESYVWKKGFFLNYILNLFWFWLNFTRLDLINPNYYEITNGWENFQTNLNESECKNLFLNNISCLFAIHSFKDQFDITDNNTNTNNMKPLNNAKVNTCILKKQLKIYLGTKKDSSSNIYYLIGAYNRSAPYLYCFYVLLFLYLSS
jgi:hypothetical protein